MTRGKAIDLGRAADKRTAVLNVLKWRDSATLCQLLELAKISHYEADTLLDSMQRTGQINRLPGFPHRYQLHQGSD